MFDRIVTIGCSFTYGYGLTDSSTQSWPAVLGKKFNVPVDNLAESGASNEHITNKLTEYTLRNNCNNSLLIIAYSQWSRQTFYSKRTQSLVHMGPWWFEKFGNKFAELLFTEFYNEKYMYKKYLLQMKLLQNHLKQMNIKYLMFEALGSCKCPNHLVDDEEIKQITMSLDLSNFIEWQTGNIDRWVFKEKNYKLPDGHPNELGHEIVANKLHQIITNKYLHKD